MMKRIIAVVSFVSIVLTVLWSHRAYSSLMLDSYVVCAGVLLALGVQNLFNDETGGYGQFIQRVMTVTAGLWLIVNLGQYSGNLTSASAAAIVLSLVWTGLRNHSAWKTRFLILQANGLSAQRNSKGAALLYRQVYDDLIARGMNLDAAVVGYQLAMALINDGRLPEGILVLNQAIPGLRVSGRQEDLAQIANFVRDLTTKNHGVQETMRLLSGPIPSLSNRPEKVGWAILEGCLAAVFVILLSRKIGISYFAVSGVWLAAYLAVGVLVALGNALLTVRKNTSKTVGIAKALLLNLAGAALLLTAVAGSPISTPSSSIAVPPHSVSLVSPAVTPANSGETEAERAFFDTVIGNQKNVEENLRSQLTQVSQEDIPQPQTIDALPHASLINRAVNTIRDHRRDQINSLENAINANMAEQQELREVYEQWKPLYQPISPAGKEETSSSQSPALSPSPIHSVAIRTIDRAVTRLRGSPAATSQIIASGAIILIVLTMASGFLAGALRQRDRSLDGAEQMIASGDLAGGIKVLENINLKRPLQGEEELQRLVLLACARYNESKTIGKDEIQKVRQQAMTHVAMALQRAPAYLPALYLEGYMLLEDGKIDDAEKPLRRAVEIDANYLSASYHLAVCLHRKAMLLSKEKQAEKATDVIEEISRLGSLDKELASTLSELNFQRMTTALKANDIDAAERECNQMVARAQQLSKGEESVRFEGLISAGRAIIAWRRDNRQEAFESAGKALETIKGLVQPYPYLDGAPLSARLKARREATDNKMDLAIPRDLHYLRALVLLRTWADMPRDDNQERTVIGKLHEELTSCLSYAPDFADALAISGLIYYYAEGEHEKGAQQLRSAQAGGVGHAFVVTTVRQYLESQHRLEEAREVGFDLMSHLLNDPSLLQETREQLQQKMERSGTFEQFLDKHNLVVNKVEERKPTLHDLSERGRILQEKVRRIIEHMRDCDESNKLQDLLARLNQSRSTLEQSVEEVQQTEGSILSQVAGIL